MPALQEMRAVGMAALQLPRALRQRGCGSIQHVAERNARYPVLLVHGYAASESVWTPLRRALVEAGFGHIVSLTYNSFATDPEAVSAELAHQALRALTATGAPRVHLVGHSLGGLIVRCALAGSAALSSQAAGAVTIASPHCGAYLARIAPGRCAQLMYRGPRLRLPKVNAPQPIRWLAYYSDGDRVVPPASARLDDPRCSAANVLIAGCGHLTICRDTRLIRSLVPELIRTETLADLLAPIDDSRNLVAALCRPPQPRPGPLRLGTPCPPRSSARALSARRWARSRPVSPSSPWAPPTAPCTA
jgi:pimeloyl-ACP methyl ester carboxylesterase